MPTSVLLAVLAAAGLLALAPALVRRYDATERLVAERATSTARVLSAPPPAPHRARPPPDQPAARTARRSRVRCRPAPLRRSRRPPVGGPPTTRSRASGNGPSAHPAAPGRPGASGQAGPPPAPPGRLPPPAGARRAGAAQPGRVGGVLLVGPGFWISFAVTGSPCCCTSATCAARPCGRPAAAGPRRGRRCGSPRSRPRSAASSPAARRPAGRPPGCSRRSCCGHRSSSPRLRVAGRDRWPPRRPRRPAVAPSPTAAAGRRTRQAVPRRPAPPDPAAYPPRVAGSRGRRPRSLSRVRTCGRTTPSDPRRRSSERATTPGYVIRERRGRPVNLGRSVTRINSGTWRSPVAHLVRIEGVRGSNPLVSTEFSGHLPLMKMAALPSVQQSSTAVGQSLTALPRLRRAASELHGWPSRKPACRSPS